MRLGWLAGLGLLVGCSQGDPGGPLGDVLERSGQQAHDSMGKNGPCLFGTWGEIGSPRRALQVRADGSDVDGDGSLSNPFATVDAAFAALQDAEARGNHAGPNRIAVGPGTFPTSLHLVAGDPRVQIVGCSAAQTTLSAVSDNASVIDVDGYRRGTLRGVTLDGGRRALRVRGGGRFDVWTSAIDDSRQVAVLVNGADSRLTLHDTEVHDPVVVDDRGWGIAVVDSGRLHMVDGGVYGATGIGLFGDHSDFVLDGIEVMDTAPSGRFGELGRGLHLQDLSSLTMEGGLFRNNADASVFLHEMQFAVINGLVIDITSAGIVIDFPSTGFSGDGIVVFGGAQTVSLTNMLITDSERAALLVDGVEVNLSGNETDDNGLVIGGYTMFAQEDAHVGGDDAGEVYDLQGPLLLNTWTLDEAPLVRE